MLKEFKQFALKGNVLDLAVAVVLGAAFGKIVSSFVSDILTPPIGKLLGNIDFSSLFLNLTSTPIRSVAEAKALGAPVIAYGLFLNAVFDFIIIAFALFLLVRQVSKMLPPPTPPVATKECPHCCTMIPVKASRCPNCTSSQSEA
ncbi:large-conductance mechanosensitive channel protein [Citrifermentans bemidjiense Bem]|uniref:Large-conductance mechanosensitive channel n=1 Tax=Citrifermentans bemidjiense (strain ATCC BAA-1014 / DSM 16622 / JCM 12645 / Bem) TaxID=404380 RepID=B5EAV7_CITBB|nr:large conductance mechanosensitive channel protein MscL [Citrifermentans bemidjiense]ACH37416.1 large-conductance mechanosensitive channel protein [Citrifermentans bemidjiense Bem]